MKKRMSERFVIFTMCLVLLMLSCGCAGTGDPADAQSSEPVTEAASDTAEAVGKTVLDMVSGTAVTHTVVRPDKAGEGMVKSASNFYKKLKDLTGADFRISDDWYKESDADAVAARPEILIGSCSRAESQQVMSELPEYGYAVRIVNNKLVIVGSDDNMTVKALFEFEERILKDGDHCGKGKLVFGKDDEFVVDCGKPVQLSEMINNKNSVTAETELVLHCEPSGDYYVGQGAASDGTYAYFLLRTSADGYAVIKKYRLDDKTFVAESEPVYVFHGNDMTYDKALNRLVISHGSSEGKILTTMDADTLKVINEKVNITQGSGAISYSVATGRFAISQGGSTLHIFTGDLQWIQSFSRITGTGYTAQGMGSDEDYVYFPMSGSSDNILQVYGWDGKYAGIIHIPLSYESESMFWVNDRYYVSFYCSKLGAYLYEIKFIMIYE